MALPASDLGNFKRWQAASGKVGFVAFLMVFLATGIGGFDWSVFLLAGGAVLLMWSRNFWLVPMYIRSEAREAQNFHAYLESDWIFVDAVGELGGSEIDAMRDAFRNADNEAARQLLKMHSPQIGDGDKVRFMHFFLRRFVGDIEVYVGETGQLVRFE